MFAFQAKQDDLLPLIAITAKFFTKDEFLPGLLGTIKFDNMPAGEAEKWRDTVMEMMSKIDDEIPDSEGLSMLRVWSADKSRIPPSVSLR